MDYITGATILKVLGEPKRTMIVDMLSCGELCACSILEAFDMSQPTLSHHMKLLCESGLVTARNEGKWTYYSLNEQGISQAKQFLAQITSGKSPCLCDKTNDCERGCDSIE